jgi:predicted MFS family arabinose efflux permease
VTAIADDRAAYRDVFSIPAFRALFAAHVISRLGDDVATVALTVVVYQRTGSPLLSALTFTVSFLPYAFVGGLFSAVVDRLPVRSTLVVSHLLSALLVAAMALPGIPIPALLTLLFLVGSLGPIFTGVRAAMLPELVPPGPPYVLTRSLFRIVSQATQVVGGAVGGLLIAVISARGALAVDAVSFALSALLVRAGSAAATTKGTTFGGSMVGDSIAGLRAVLGHPALRRVLLFGWLITACAVAPESLATPYVVSLGEPASFVGVYFMALPIGLILGDLVGARVLTSRMQRRALVPSACLCFIPLLIFAFRPPFALIFAILVIAGTGFLYGVAMDQLVVTTAPPELRSRALAIENSGMMAIQALGYAIWGGVGEFLAPRWTVPLAAVCGLAAIARYAPRRAQPANAEPPDR